MKRPHPNPPRQRGGRKPPIHSSFPPLTSSLPTKGKDVIASEAKQSHARQRPGIRNIPRFAPANHPPQGGTKRARALRLTPVLGVVLFALAGLVCVNQLTFQRLTRTTETFAERKTCFRRG